MFTRNYWLQEAAILANKATEVCGDSTTTGKPKFITVSGEVGENTYSSSYKYKGIGSYRARDFFNYVKAVDVSQNTRTATGTNLLSYGLVFGSGNTPVTVDDYRLSGDPILNITYSRTENYSYEEDGSSGTISCTYTITNNNDTDITIGEVGMFAETSWQTYYGSTPYTNFFYMYGRIALESPITIAPGGVGQVTVTEQFNYPVT